ncbi:MAG TPA: hypothetical protein VFO65_08770 [Acidimicrobiales bacterium]|nr:hypothetical protein [Acidimicrobiales bacterium]
MYCTKRVPPAPGATPGLAAVLRGGLAGRRSPEWPRNAGALRPAAATFAVSGTVTAVGHRSLTLDLDVTRANRRAARTGALTVAVPVTAAMILDGHPAHLSLLQPGDHVSVRGLRSPAGWSATTVHTSSPAFGY